MTVVSSVFTDCHLESTWILYFYLYDLCLLYCVVQVSLARPSCELIKGANLYVSGLPKSMTQRELEAMFAPAGNIITSRILCDSQTGSLLSLATMLIA